MEIFFQDYSRGFTQKAPIRKATIPFSPDLSRMEEGFSRRRRLRKHFPRFLDCWNKWMEKGLLMPRVSCVGLHREDVSMGWHPFFRGLRKPIPRETRWAFPTVWSLGRGLDDHSVCLKRNNHSFEALLFDMAGGLIALQVNRKFKKWLAETLLAPAGFSFLGEILPGKDGVKMEIVPDICNLAYALERTGVSVGQDNFLSPLKSGCAVVLAGHGPATDLSFIPRCEPCLGSKCLYSQLGLCFAEN